LADEHCFNDGVQLDGDRTKALLEQYKLYVDSTSKISDRRGAANTFLLSTNSALVTVYGLAAGKDTTLAGSNGAAAWLIPVAGLTISVSWIALIRSYRAVNRAKFEVINNLEGRLPARLFNAEWQILKSRHLPFTYVEQLVPGAFMIIYAALLFVATR